jgi:hypothetical protein
MWKRGPCDQPIACWGGGSALKKLGESHSTLRGFEPIRSTESHIMDMDDIYKYLNLNIY